MANATLPPAPAVPPSPPFRLSEGGAVLLPPLASLPFPPEPPILSMPIAEGSLPTPPTLQNTVGDDSLKVADSAGAEPAPVPGLPLLSKPLFGPGVPGDPAAPMVQMFAESPAHGLPLVCACAPSIKPPADAPTAKWINWTRRRRTRRGVPSNAARAECAGHRAVAARADKEVLLLLRRHE
jgi:hypothetical protein